MVNKKKSLFLYLFFIQVIFMNKVIALETKEDIFEPIKSKIKKYTLENGLKIIFMQNGANPTVALYWKILAGSSDENPSNSGIAHMLEHMLFKGTKIVGTVDYEKEKKYLEVLNIWYHRLDAYKSKLESANEEKEKWEKKIQILEKRISILEGEVKKYQISEEDSIIYSINGQRGYNAYTSEDVTNYQIELPSNRIEIWAKLESDRIQNSVFREFYTERNVVAEERRMRVENNPFGFLYEKFIEEIYKGHPYGYPTIGPMKNILNFKKEQAEEYFKNYYRPDNTVIAVVGNFDQEKTFEIIKKYFSNWKKSDYPIPRNKVKKLEYRKVDLKIEKDGSPVQLLAWKKPNFPSRENLVLEILADILTGRMDTRLHKKLIEEQKYASNISLYTSEPGERYENLFLFVIFPNLAILKDPNNKEELKEIYNKIQQSILEELEEIKKNGIKEEELNRVKQVSLTKFIKKMRSNAYLADIFTYYELIYGDYSIIFDYYKMIDSITSSEIQKVVKEYLSPELIYKAELYPIQ